MSAALEWFRRLQVHERKLLARFDPNDDPGAEPITIVAVLTLVVACAVSLAFFVSYRLQPMQDLGHHLALAAVYADRGKPGSVYNDLYERMDVLSANSLLYTLAAPLSRVMKVTTAVRGMLGFYLLGVPLATAWALRVYGRSIWPAVLSTALVYNMVYVAGFANLLFAAPFMILALPVLDRCLERRTTGWIVGSIALYVVIFLSHAHGFLWIGFLSALLVLARVIAAAVAPHPIRARVREALAIAVVASAAVAPSLVLFVRWYHRTFGEGRHAGGVAAATAGAADKFGAWWRSPKEVLTELVTTTVKLFSNDDKDLKCVMTLMALLAFSVAFSRLHRYRRAPVLELACAVTFASYFLLPEGLTGHDVLASRQVSLALWFAPALFGPVPARTSRVARAAVVAGIVVVTVQMLSAWRAHLRDFATESQGLFKVLAKAPQRKWLHYVKAENSSSVFTWYPYLHVDKYYASEAYGQIADTPAILSTAAIRYRTGIDIHRVADHGNGWVRNDEIWKNFDLVLTRRWVPTADQLAVAREKGTLLAAEGEWQLWQSRIVQR